jgi:hypothetical protein
LSMLKLLRSFSLSFNADMFVFLSRTLILVRSFSHSFSS